MAKVDFRVLEKEGVLGVVSCASWHFPGLSLGLGLENNNKGEGGCFISKLLN
jgi:hypothetical protein